MNFMDNAILEDALADADSDGRIVKSRARLNKEYGRIGSGTDAGPDLDTPPEYADQTDEGYVGIGIQPMG